MTIKKSISIFLTFLMTVTCFLTAFASTSVNASNTLKTEILNLEGEQFKFTYDNNSQFRKTIVENEDGILDTFEYDIINSRLYRNGVLVETEITTSISSRAWVEYDTSSGKINVSGMALGAAVGAVSAATGIAGGLLSGAIAVYVNDNMPQLYFSFESTHYYWDPVTTSRPKIMTETDLYYGPDNNEFIGTF